MSLLIACLNHQNIAEGAAESLVSGFVRDITGHMNHFERYPHALTVIMDVMYRATPVVQTHLTNLFSFAIKWPRATEFIKKSLQDGLLALLSYMLKVDALATQEAAIGAVTALLQKVSIVAELQDFVPALVDNILLNHIVDTVTRISTSPEFRIDSKAMFHAVAMYELLSIHPYTHAVLYAPIDTNSASPKHSANTVSAFTQSLKLLNLLSEKTDNMDIYSKTISSILTFSYYLISAAPKKENFVENTSLLKSCCRVLCKSKLPELKQETVNLLHLFAARTTAVAAMLLEKRAYLPFADALIVSSMEDTGLKRSSSGAEGEEEEEEENTNFSLDLLAFTLAQFFNLSSFAGGSSAPLSLGMGGMNSAAVQMHLHAHSDDSDGMTYCTMLSDTMTDVDIQGSVRELFSRVVHHNSIWQFLVAHLRSTCRQKITFASRVLHVLASYKDLRIMTKLHEQILNHNVLDCLVDALARVEDRKAHNVASELPPNLADALNSEMLLLALGSILGSSAYFPWETDTLSMAPLHATPSSFYSMPSITSPLPPSRGGAFMSPNKLPPQQNPSVNFEREEKLIFQTQRRVDLEYGTSAVEWQHDPSAAVVLEIERQLREECAARLSPHLQAIIGNDGAENVGASVAALRVLQIILRDSINTAPSVGSDTSKALAAEVAAQIHYYCFVTLLPDMNKVQALIALDVLGLMTLHADFSVDEAVQIVTDLLQTHDSVVKCKALDTLVCFSVNQTCLASIHAFSLTPLSHMLRYLQHLHEPTIDTPYVLASVLLILTRLVVDEVVCNAILKSAMFTGLVELLKLEDPVLSGQALADGYERNVVTSADEPKLSHQTPPSLRDNRDGVAGRRKMGTIGATVIRHFVFRCIHAFASHNSCRSMLLGANIPHHLLKQLSTFVGVDKVTKKETPEVPQLLIKGCVVESPDEECQGALNSLFLLSFKAHRSLKDSLATVPAACHSLMRIWAGPIAPLSYKASVVLMRCGISTELTKSQLARSINTVYEALPLDQMYKQFSCPWTVFIDTCQVFLLLDLIDDAQDTAPRHISSGASVISNMNSIVTFDEFTDSQVKVTACEALHCIVRRAQESPSEFQHVQVTLQELCKTDILIPRLEGMVRLTPCAAVLISDIRQLSDLRFEDNLQEMGQLLEKQLRSRSVLQRQQGITLLAMYFRKHPTDRVEVIPTLPMTLIKKAVSAATRHCLIKSFQRARSSFIADLPAVVELIMSILEVYNVLAAQLAACVEDSAAEEDEDSVSSADQRDDLGIQKYLGYSPDTPDYLPKSLFDALTVLSGHENSALVLVKCRHLTEGLLETLKIQFDFIHAHRDAGLGTSSPSQFLEDEEVEKFELQLVLINSIFDVLLHLSTFAEEALTQRLLQPCAVATGDDETGLEMLLTYSVDLASTAILTYRPDGPRNVKFALKSFTMRPIEASLAELLFFTLYHLSCSGTLSTAAVYITHPIFLCELTNHFSNDIDNWLSLVPHLLDAREQANAPASLHSPMSSLSVDDGSPIRSADKPTQSMEAYVADILCAKLGMLTNLCRVSTGRDRIFEMQKELQSLLQLVVLHVELPDVKLIYASLMLLTSLVPMIYQSDLSQKVVNSFVEATLKACLNAAGRLDDITVVDKVKCF